MYGLDVDLSDPMHDPILTARSWRWLIVRVHGLLSRPEPTRLAIALFPPAYAATQDPPRPEHRPDPTDHE